MTYSLFDSYRSLKVPVKSVMDDLVMMRKLCNTFSSRVSYINICQCISNSFFSGFANRFLRLFSTQWCSAPPSGGCQSIASSYYGVIGRHLSCLIRNAVFSYELSTSKTDMNAKRKKCYERPKMNVVEMRLTQIIATSSNVTVGGWGEGGVSVAEKPKNVLQHAVALGVIYGLMNGLTTNRELYEYRKKSNICSSTSGDFRDSCWTRFCRQQRGCRSVG